MSDNFDILPHLRKLLEGREGHEYAVIESACDQITRLQSCLRAKNLEIIELTEALETGGFPAQREVSK